MNEQKGNAYDYAKAKIFMKLSCWFIVSVVLMVVVRPLSNTPALMLVPAVMALFPLGFAVYYFVLFKKGMVGARICTITDKKKDVLASITSGLNFNRNKYFFTYEEGGEQKTFSITRSSFLSSLSVGASYLVLYRRGELTGDNMMEYVQIQDLPKSDPPPGSGSEEDATKNS